MASSKGRSRRFASLLVDTRMPMGRPKSSEMITEEITTASVSFIMLQ